MKRGVDIFDVISRLPENYLEGIPLEFWHSPIKFKIAKSTHDTLKLTNPINNELFDSFTFTKAELAGYHYKLVRSVYGTKIVIYKND